MSPRTTRDRLFLQVLKDVKHLLRLNLRVAGGDTSLRPERDELANALQVKRALLAGLEAAADRD